MAITESGAWNVPALPRTAVQPRSRKPSRIAEFTSTRTFFVGLLLMINHLTAPGLGLADLRTARSRCSSGRPPLGTPRCGRHGRAIEVEQQTLLGVRATTDEVVRSLAVVLVTDELVGSELGAAPHLRLDQDDRVRLRVVRDEVRVEVLAVGQLDLGLLGDDRVATVRQIPPRQFFAVRPRSVGFLVPKSTGWVSASIFWVSGPYPCEGPRSSVRPRAIGRFPRPPSPRPPDRVAATIAGRRGIAVLRSGARAAVHVPVAATHDGRLAVGAEGDWSGASLPSKRSCWSV